MMVHVLVRIVVVVELPSLLFVLVDQHDWRRKRLTRWLRRWWIHIVAILVSTPIERRIGVRVQGQSLLRLQCQVRKDRWVKGKGRIGDIAAMVLKGVVACRWVLLQVAL